MSLYEHVRHPWRDERREQGPVKVADQHAASNAVQRFNARLAVTVTAIVGSMWCAYAFAALAVAGLPSALQPGNIGLLFWVSSDLLQLTLLSVIIVGQNIQAKAADARAESTWKDAETILHGQEQQAEHLAAQDEAITSIQQHLREQDTAVAGILTQVEQILEHVRPAASPPNANSADGGSAP